MKELDPLVKDNVRDLLEKRLPDLAEKFDDLVKVTTRTENRRGASIKRKYEVLEVFKTSGRQLIKEIAPILGYKNLEVMPYAIRSNLYYLIDQFSFESNPERWIRLIEIGLSDYINECERNKILNKWLDYSNDMTEDEIKTDYRISIGREPDRIISPKDSGTEFWFAGYVSRDEYNKTKTKGE